MKEEGYQGQVASGEYTYRETAVKNLRIPTVSLLFRNVVLEDGLPKWIRYVYGGDRATIYILATYGGIYVLNFEGAVYRAGVGVEVQYHNQRQKARRNIKEYLTYLRVVDIFYKHHYLIKILRNCAYLFFSTFSNKKK